MNRLFYIRSLMLLCMIISVHVSTYSQTENQVVPGDLKQQTIVTEPATLMKGFLRAGILLNYRVADRYFSESGSKEYYTSSTWNSKAAYNVTLQYGLTDRLQIDVYTEYLNIKRESQSIDNVSVSGATTIVKTEQKGMGIGDSHLALNYQFIPEDRYKVSLTGKIHLTVPTGEKNPTDIISDNEYDLPVGDGTYALSAGPR